MALLPAGAFAQTREGGAREATESARTGPQLEVAVRGGAAWSDNISRTTVDEESGLIAQTGLDLSYLQQTRRLDADIDIDATYEKYQDGAFDDDVVGGMDARLTIGIAPERFLWVLQDNFGQAMTDPFAASIPGNRENINYFSTGPDLILNLGTTTQLRVTGRIADVDYENTAGDNQRTSGSIAVAHELSGSATVSLVGEGNRIEFDDGVAPTYSQYAGYGRYRLVSTRTELTVDAGYTRLDTETGDSGGALVRIELDRRMSSASSLTASIGSEFTDASNVLRSGQGLFGPSRNISNVVGASDPFENRYAIVSYDFFRNRTGFGLRIQKRQERYETATSIDRNLTTWNAYFSRQLSPRLEARLYYDLEQQRMQASDFEADESRAGGYLSWQMARTVALRLDVERFDRESSNVASEYTEGRAALFIVWTPVRRQ